MTRWSLERARSCSALAYGSRSTAAATASAPSYTTSGDATCRVGLFDLRPRWNSIAVAVETKVSDPVKEKQIGEYEREEHQAVLYLPGLTGFLIEGQPPVQP
jgi:hypothetical protein